ncbi:ArsR/SmtB family transcription factor [Methylobacterium pseudosasicola]|uniref:Transcriptional regulator, ArsR family n=1 Tax=Methylobacterium pseudosasicola TaxID=582667 RepID=A0A1I4S2B7_9HYPH|nr:helix-turn-helix transcriptional regulator [Methylobacterium pseudosasicola]SFM58658.1 transcriptional regulator, ArsR family [Methylobacterium pseudosasicola]
MNPHPSLATAAFLIADPARSVMLMHLLDGKARPAGELAFAAGITAQTASSHLGKLLAGGLLAVETEGRHRYYRLAGPQVALALETLAAIGPAAPVRSKPLSREARELRFARCCYDHLAGHLGVAVTGALQARGYLVPAAGKRFDVPPAGAAWFAGLGLEVDRLRPGRHGLARQCLDWTEREHQLAGPLGVQLMSLLCAKGWLRRSETTRAVQVTPTGWTGLKKELGLDPV